MGAGDTTDPGTQAPLARRRFRAFEPDHDATPTTPPVIVSIATAIWRPGRKYPLRRL